MYFLCIIHFTNFVYFFQHKLYMLNRLYSILLMLSECNHYRHWEIIKFLSFAKQRNEVALPQLKLWPIKHDVPQEYKALGTLIGIYFVLFFTQVHTKLEHSMWRAWEFYGAYSCCLNGTLMGVHVWCLCFVFLAWSWKFNCSKNQKDNQPGRNSAVRAHTMLTTSLGQGFRIPHGVCIGMLRVGFSFSASSTQLLNSAIPCSQLKI